jgi:uncharacterized protein (DUF342 family)
VSLLEVKVGDLVTRELGAHHGTGMLPGCAVLGEDAAAKEGHEVAAALGADVKVFKLGGEDSLDIFLVYAVIN